MPDSNEKKILKKKKKKLGTPITKVTINYDVNLGIELDTFV